MKKSERLRQLKGKAVERMTELVTLARNQSRDLTAEEQKEYNAKQAEAEDLAAQIDAALKEEAAAEPAAAEEALKKAADAAVQEERLRQETIRERVKAANLGAEFADALAKEGLTAEQASERIFAELAKKSKEHPPQRPHVELDRDAGDTLRETMAATLLHRYEPQRYKAEAEKGREWIGYSLMEMARECLRRHGTPLSGKGPGEIATLALTTSDFPAILENVAGKTLRAGYETYPNTFQPFCRRATARDFKPVSRTMLSGAPAMLKVNENGEIEQGYLTDSKETYFLVSYGRIVNITRKTIINDDLGAFTRIPELMGRKAAMLEGDIVWAIVTANGKMADGKAIFHADHKNLAAQAAAITVDSVGAGMTAMALQTGLEGDALNLTPKFIAMPVGKKLVWDKLTTPVAVTLMVTNGTPSVEAVPDTIRSLTPIAEPRLDKASATAWHLFASPNQVDTIEYCYLEGQEGMYFEQQIGFEVDGIKFKARHDFGAGAIDHRGMYKNAGQ